MKIETDANGNAVIWHEVAGKAVPLPAENLYVRASDGHCFVAPPGEPPLARLRPHEVEMMEHWLHERAGDIAPNVFAGRIPPDG